MARQSLFLKFSGWSLLALALLLSFGGILPAGAEYTVDPLRVELQFPQQGSVATTSVRIKNTGTDAIRLKAYMANWTLDEGGGLQIFEEEAPQAIAKQVRFNPKEFEIPANSTQVVRLAVTLPPETQPGEYRGMLFFEDLKTESQRLSLAKGYGASVQIKQRLGIAVYVYKGTAKPNPRLTEFQCHLEDNKLKTEIQLENQGTKHLRVSGTLLISQQDKDGHIKPFMEIPINDFRDIIVLPKTSRKIQQLLAPTPGVSAFPPGQYAVELRFSAETGEGIQPISASTTVIWPDASTSQNNGSQDQSALVQTRPGG